MKLQCTIHKPLTCINGRYYIFLNLLSQSDIQKCTKKNVDINPLQGSVLKVKVPFRYNRIMCKTDGIKTIHEALEGDHIMVDIEYTGEWSIDDTTHGSTWKLMYYIYK